MFNLERVFSSRLLNRRHDLLKPAGFCPLRLESPTRTLSMEAPRGVEVSAEKGPLGVSGRKDLQLESTEGEVSLLV